MMRIAALLFALMAVAKVHAGGSPPSWTTRTPTSDGKYKYYVGRSSLMATDEAAYQAADKNAREMAIKDNFDSFMRVETVTSETLTSSQSSSRMEERTRLINLNGFERVEDFVTTEEIDGSKRSSTWILFKYSLQAIDKEKSRLAQIVDDGATQFNESGPRTCSGDNFATLEVVSSEASAQLFVDEAPIGFTPIRIRCHFPIGKTLRIRVEHPRFQSFEDQVILSQGGTHKVTALLRPATVKLTVKSIPPGARVSVAGEYKGVAPVSFDAPAGMKLQVVLSHPEAERLMQEIELDKDVPFIERLFDLPSKPSFLSVSTNPQKSSILLDGSPLGNGISPTGAVPCPVGSHRLTIRKSGYRTIETSVECRGGQKHVLPTIELMAWRGFENRAELYLGYLGPTIKDAQLNLMTVGVQYSRRFTTFVGIAAGGGAVTGKTSYSNADLGSSGFATFFGLPMYVSLSGGGRMAWEFDLRPEITYMSQTFTANYSNGASVTTSAKNQFGYGVSVGTSVGSESSDNGGVRFSGRIGGMQYGDADQVKGAIGVYAQVGVGWAW